MDNKVKLIADFLTLSCHGLPCVVDARPHIGDSWIVRATDKKITSKGVMTVKWQMVAPQGKREAKRIAEKILGVYIDFGCFLVTDDDYSRVIEECIKTRDVQGLRIITALRQGDDKAEFKKKIEKIIKDNGLNKPHENAIRVIKKGIVR
ncbi:MULTISPECIES: hypothetical protein [unclassified Nostoc]|uniref:hypothetical protein n=1 Tax=unclassified Nostoc TaxID=2593658 RepID=UPI002AD2CEBA|nr:hypothetical protein [Nostoc sp. DedQUE03]MDZ7977561.1 hypothetical protein [Nostoc sp. DedQUE03]MDZ8049333.1 hypothetical protein [Nostoc sp. DedQUE02]